MTQRERIANVIAMLKGEEISQEVKDEMLEGFEHDAEVLDNKKVSKENSKEAKEKLEIRAKALEVLKACTDEDGMRATPIAEQIGCSVNKVVPQLTSLVKEGLVLRHEIKRNGWYKAAATE